MPRFTIRAAYNFTRSQQEAYGKRDLRIEILGQDHTPEEITPYLGQGESLSS